MNYYEPEDVPECASCEQAQKDYAELEREVERWKKAAEANIEENVRLRHEAHTWSKACEAATTKLHKLRTFHPRLEVRSWQPIETAPTDGTRILLCGRGGKIADGHYGQPDGWANPKRFVWPYIHANPTHWMPLPAPPIGRCIPCRETGALHCHDPLHCGGPWSEAPQNAEVTGGPLAARPVD